MVARVTQGDERLEAGMRAQLSEREDRLDAGEEPVGWKLGLTVEDVQSRLGLEGPVVGYLTSGRLLAPGERFSLSGLERPALEPEIAVHIGRDVAAGASRDEVQDAIDALGVAVEVIESGAPFEDLEEIVAANIFHRAVMLGPPVAERAGGWLSGVTLTVLRDGDTEEGLDVEAGGPDLHGVVWHVAGMLEAFDERLSAGDVIIAGSLTPPVPVAPGNEVVVDLGPLGHLQAPFGP